MSKLTGGMHTEFVDASDRKAIGKMLQKARMEAGLRQADVAEKLNADQTNISRLENGRAAASVKYLTEYAEAIGCKLVIGIEPQ